MTRLLLLGASMALFPIALAAATPPNQTSRGVGESRNAGSPTAGRGAGQPERTASQPSRASSGAGLGGAPIPGLCMLSQSAVLSNAKVALAADARLKQLNQQVQAEQSAINGDAQALEAQRASLGPADFQKRQAALQARASALQQKSQLRQRELAATRQKALNRISTEAQPIIAQAFRAHDCSLLFDHNSVLLGNMSGDITAEVARGLDAKISTITFEREKLAQ